MESVPVYESFCARDGRAPFLLLCTLLCFVIGVHAAPENLRPEIVRLEFAGPPSMAFTEGDLVLRGSDARRQILVEGYLDTGEKRDVTHQVDYKAEKDGVIQVAKGMVIPLRAGKTILTARLPSGVEARLPVKVEDFESTRPIHFANQIVPIFTKAGCNGGGCHGKSAGQNGFRLSLLGFEPWEDYDHLVRESRGRRIFPAAPDRSLLLEKATATLPHGGGKRIDVDSDDYRLLVRWIQQGMPTGDPKAPTVDSIEVFPKQAVMSLGGEQQLIVTAKYTDGATEDVTRGALFEPNDKDMAKVDVTGFVQLMEQPGEVAVMIRYQSKVAVFRATIPLGAPVGELPLARNFVDEIVFRKLKMVGTPPSAICDDPSFVRRVTIDIAGRLPSAAEVETFLNDKSPKKRDQLIDRLLASSDYADYFANKWAALLRNKRKDQKNAPDTFAFHDWVRDSLIENKPYSQFVREILTASGDISENPPVAWYSQVREQTTELEDTAQLFLGMRLQCAQCHHHPYEKWSQQDYYRFAAFFSRVGRKPSGQPGEEVIFHKRGRPEATNKKTKQPESPAGLGASVAKIPADEDPRDVLAEWVTSKKNPYFARSLVNRYWKHFFNRGLVEPEDDMRETNPPTNPELLDALAAHFIENSYDLKDLIRVMTSSSVYQLSAIPNQYNRADKQNFSRYYPKRLTAEVLYDAVNQITLGESHFDGLPVGTRAVQLPDNSFNASSYFLTVFGRPESSSACECERSQDASLAQSLHLLNSKDIQEKLASDKSRAALLAADEKCSDETKVKELYCLAYAREAESAELDSALKYLKEHGKDAKSKRAAYEDLVWALVNTKEFLFNH
jgi:hypothetical protein